MFEIKNEKKDEIFSDVGYKIHKDNGERRVEIILPTKKKKRGNATLADSKDGLLTDLPYNLSTKTFRYPNAETEGELPPLILDLKNCGALGIIENKNTYFMK